MGATHLITVTATSVGKPNNSDGKDFELTVDAAITSPPAVPPTEITVANDFNLAAATDVAQQTYVESNAVTLSGFNVPIALRVRKGEVSVNAGAWTNDIQTVKAGDVVKVRVFSAPLPLTTATAEIAVGGLVKTFSATTAVMYDLHYSAGVHGSLSGTVNQTVAQGISGSTVTAVPDSGYHFVSWSDGVTTASRTDANVSGNLTVTASFVLDTTPVVVTYDLHYSAGVHGSLSGTVNQTVAQGVSGSTVTAVAESGYHFVSWSDGVTTASRTDANVNGNLTVSASFALDVPVPAIVQTSYTAPTATATGAATVAISGGGAGCGFTAAQFVVVTTALPNVAFPHGLFDFSLGSCTLGSTVTVSITYPTALPADTQYWKYGAVAGNVAAHWYPIPATIAGNTITFSITDGGVGDNDLTANGSIVDPGGPAVPAAGAITPTAIPTLSEWNVMLLAGIVSLIGLVGVQRRLMW